MYRPSRSLTGRRGYVSTFATPNRSSPVAYLHLQRSHPCCSYRRSTAVGCRRWLRCNDMLIWSRPPTTIATACHDTRCCGKISQNRVLERNVRAASARVDAARSHGVFFALSRFHTFFEKCRSLTRTSTDSQNHGRISCRPKRMPCGSLQ